MSDLKPSDFEIGETVRYVPYHAQDIERALDAHFRTHSTVDWVRATVRLRAKNKALATELRETDEALGDYTVNIIRSLPEAAAKLRVEVEAHKRSRQIDANEARSREMEFRAEVERLRVGHDRYEFLRRCSLRQLTQIWEAALKSDAQFDATVDKLRLPAPTTAP